jgi:hypothetical protein
VAAAGARARALGVAAASLALAACGGDGGGGGETPKERYTREFRAAVDAVEQRGRALPELEDDAPLPEQAEQIRRGILLLRDLADRLDAIEAPAEAVRAHARFVRALRGFADDATAIVRAARAGDMARVERLLSLRPGANFADVRNVRLVALARREFDRLGYDVVPPLPQVPGR